MKKFSIDGAAYSFDINYCYVSQRGYYPNALGKANQDSYVICENILGDKNCHMFGVFDGHGEYGDHCSYFAADNFAQQLGKDLKSAGGCDVLDTPKMNALYTNAFVKVNKAMHKSNIDDSLSGTTGITVIVKGDVLYVGNVGDSRAIIASDVDGVPKFSALSSDQTPFRKDERDRLKAKGAQIMTLDQIEGNEPLHDNWGAETGEEIDEVGDPPRVWDNSLERPGCAFTRSIGDAVAEKVGVYAEPEILTWKLSATDRLAIVASDGVFEFLTSQAVVDMVVKFRNPLDAAKHVVAEAYRLWLTYDDRTDDITIIIIVFDNFVKKSAAVLTDRSANNRSDTSKVDSKPIRTVLSKAKRKVISESMSAEDNVDFDFAANASPKTDEELRRISEMVSSNFMFQHLSAAQKSQIFNVMKLKEVQNGEVIIREGDPGDQLYIIDSGQFTVHKKDEHGVSQLVFTYTTVGAVFGELSLMYGKPRAASVIARTNGRLWTIGRAAFRASLMKRQQQGLMKTLRTVPVLSNLLITQLQRICELTTEGQFKDGEYLFREGETVPWALCIILSGSVRTRGKTAGKKEKNRKEGSYIAAPEVGPTLVEAAAEDGKVLVAFIPMEVFVDIVGKNAKQLLIDQCSKTHRGTPLAKQASIFSSAEVLQKTGLVSTKNRAQYKIDMAVMLIGGDFSYLGNSKDKDGNPVSVKVISKKEACNARMEQKLLNEKLFLVAMNGGNDFIPSVLATCQDDKTCLLVYSHAFVGDLGMCLSAGVSLTTKLYYAACIYSGLTFVHEFGLMHRFMNTESVYVTTEGVPMIVDFRNTKKMEGSKVFTVCGDPLYFAPEIITQQGYDYSCDLWAFGCLFYELFEERTPFGTDQTEETTLFKAITSYKEGALVFTDKTPEEARPLISSLIHPNGAKRAGFKSSEEVRSAAYFKEIVWNGLVDIMKNNTSATLTPTPVDLSASVFGNNEANLEDFDSPVFDDY